MTTAAQSQASQNRTKKYIGILSAMFVALVGIAGLAAIHHPGHMDFIAYWSSGSLIAHHLNPYSPEKVMALETAHGFTLDQPFMVFNPPWSLFLVAPLGFVSDYPALFLWLTIIIVCTLASILLLHRNSRYGPLALIFAPVIACINSGQSGGFLLLGFALFLHFQHRRPFLAGASLLFMAIKPHLFLVFWVVLLVDCLCRRKYRILGGAASALAASSMLSMCFDLHIWKDYIAMMFGYQIQQALLPTLSMLFRMAIDVRAFWLLFIPSVIAVVWGLWYYLRLRQVWDWRTHGLLLMLVTVLASPYGYFSDQVVLLPCIAFGLCVAGKDRYSRWLLLILNSVTLFIVLRGTPLSSLLYVWTPAAWLLWFLYATNGLRRISLEVSSADTIPLVTLEGA